MSYLYMKCTYRNLNFVDHSQHYVVTMTTSSHVSGWLWMTLMTTMKRGAAEIRERMRTQDPRLGPSTELAPKDDGRLAFSPPRMLSGQAPLFLERGRGDGALRRNTESQGPQQPVEAVHEEAPLPLEHDVLDAVQPREGAKKMPRSLLRLPPAPSGGIHHI